MAVEIKICGITCIEDAVFSAECGVTHLGFNFWKPSPRYVDPERAAGIIAALDHACQAVGVFVNEDPGRVAEIARTANLDIVQLCGDEQPGDFQACPARVWRAIRPGGGKVDAALQGWGAERVLVDAHVPGAYGGTGTVADWETAAALSERLPLILAGGLTPQNVADAIRAVHPLGVDTASGVESGPGRKDHDKIRNFVEAAGREAGS